MSDTSLLRFSLPIIADHDRYSRCGEAGESDSCPKLKFRAVAVARAPRRTRVRFLRRCLLIAVTGVKEHQAEEPGAPKYARITEDDNVAPGRTSRTSQMRIGERRGYY